MSMPSTQQVTHHVAKKEHRCCECRGIIAPQDVYERTFGVWDGTAETFKTCSHCEEARDWLLNETPWKENTWMEDGAVFLFGELREHLREVVTEIDGKLLFPAYRRLIALKRRGSAAKAIRLENVKPCWPHMTPPDAGGDA